MRKPILLFPLSILAAAVLAASSDADVLALARQKQLEFRQGDASVVAPLVETLEAATAKSPDNAALWEALGHASMSKSATLFTAQPNFPDIIASTQQARDAYARALALDPANMLALASHGMASMIAAQYAGDGPGMAAGAEEMNEAVSKAPKYVAVRLTRAFTTINFPAEMRDNDALIGDLRFILDSTTSARPTDVLHLLLGDVHAEAGKLDAARAEYAQVTGASAFAAAEVKLRRAELEKGAVPPASIAKVRAITGTKCATCHAARSDN